MIQVDGKPTLVFDRFALGGDEGKRIAQQSYVIADLGTSLVGGAAYKKVWEGAGYLQGCERNTKSHSWGESRQWSDKSRVEDKGSDWEGR